LTATLPPAREAAPSFADARGCKEWLNSLPLTNIPQAQSLVLEGLRGLNGGALDGLERLKCLELLRDKIAFLQGEQRSRYFGKSLPLSNNDAAAWTTGSALLEEMEAGYRACLPEAVPGAALAAHASLIAQRVVRYLGAQMTFHAIVYRRFEPQLWIRLHGEYARSRDAGIAEEPVKDSLEGGEEGASSVAEAYVQVVLMQAAYLAEMSAAQMDFAEALLRLWVRKVRVLDAGAAPRLPVHALVVDPERPIGARPVPHAQLQPGQQVLDVDALGKSMRKRIHGLQSDEDPSRLGLPPEAAGVVAVAQLQRLYKLWCEGAPPRPPAKASELKAAGLVFGLAEAHFFASGGKAFEQPDKSRELTHQEKQDIEVFGRVTERTHSRMQSEHNYTVESWPVIDEMPGTWRLQRPASASRGVAIGRLVAVRLGDAAPFYLGMVSALVQETDGKIVITVTLFPGRPEPIAVRSADARHRANAQWVQGFRLPALERLNIASSLIVPNGTGSRGRGIETWDEVASEAVVREVLERGNDFDRVTVS
jgi:hypothetical protein